MFSINKGSLSLYTVLASYLLLSYVPAHAQNNYVAEAGHASLQEWLLPDEAPYPAGNKPNEARIALGKMLFFDTRLSGDKTISCATCHSPLYGWGDGLKTGKGFGSKILDRASPVVTNTAFNSIQMWDGRKKSLEDQAMGPMEATAEMNMKIPTLLKFLNDSEGYRAAFNKAYPGEKIDTVTLSKGMASFERTIISNNSPFDKWVKGDAKAMTKQQIQGFKVFVGKANCVACHSAPNFTDNGFHNIGLASYGEKNPDVGRFTQRPLKLMKGAFKTPTLRDISYSAPYFHDGSSHTLTDVVNHYAKGGVVKTNLSPNMEDIKLSDAEKKALVAFMEALNSKREPFTLPVLPVE